MNFIFARMNMIFIGTKPIWHVIILKILILTSRFARMKTISVRPTLRIIVMNLKFVLTN